MKILACAVLLTIGAMIVRVDPAAATLVCAPSSGPGAGTMCKLCSGIVANNWRDSLVVPNPGRAQRASHTRRVSAQRPGNLAASDKTRFTGQHSLNQYQTPDRPSRIPIAGGDLAQAGSTAAMPRSRIE